MRRRSSLLAALLALTLVPCLAATGRSPWKTERVSELASLLVDQTQRLAAELRAASDEAEAATDVPRREAYVGVRTVVIRDVAILKGRAESYVAALEKGFGREETRSLFGRIESLVSLTAGDVRAMPDYVRYKDKLEALVKTVATLGRFYAEPKKIGTPPEPQRQLERWER